VIVFSLFLIPVVVFLCVVNYQLCALIQF